MRKNFRAPVINSTVEQEYRLICRDGHPLWVLDRSRLMRSPGRAPVFNTMLMDITERKQAQEACALSLERHQIIMDQTNDIIFEWNIVQDTLSFSNNWQKKFGYAPIRREISTRIPSSKDVHPDDMPAFCQLLKAVSAGAPYSSAEFRIRSWDGRYLWCRIRATTQFDSEGRPIKAVGVITDIDAEKKHEQRLLEPGPEGFPYRSAEPERGTIPGCRADRGAAAGGDSGPDDSGPGQLQERQRPVRPSVRKTRCSPTWRPV